MTHDHHDHDPGHGHSHDHSHDHGTGDDPALDLSVPDAELNPGQLRRRGFLRGAGLLGAGIAGASVLGGAPALADEAVHGRPQARRNPRRGFAWLAGDHHIHTQHSNDAMYRVADQVQHASAYGLDWMVITDHGSVGHAKFGVEKVNPDIRAARAALEDLLVFQGLEWNIPAAEHATVIVTPGPNEVAVLKAFENAYDGAVTGTTGSAEGDPKTLANEALAIQGLQWLAGRIGQQDGVDDAVMLANHPARKGLDTPHEFRAWRDQGRGVAIGMEGAPGHQAAGLPDGNHTSGARGEYANTATSIGANAWSGYTTPNWELYRTWGGFDPFTAIVGGLWDSLLSEGKGWWITANSDSHKAYLDPYVTGPLAPTADGTPAASFAETGAYLAPVEVAAMAASDGLGYSDFFPGFYSRTHVGTSSFGYQALLAGLRAGRVWVDHGRLLDELQVRVSAKGWDLRGVTLGGTLRVAKGSDVVLTVDLTPAQAPNHNGDAPKLGHVDIIRGLVTGPVQNPDTFVAPNTSVVKTYDISGRTGRTRIQFTLRGVNAPFYLRLRGSDGRRSSPGYYPAQDPNGPKMDVIGDADPWKDLWFYSNPIFVDVR